MISYLSLIFVLVVLTGGISSALLLSSLTNSGKVIVLTIYFVLLLIVIIGFTISKVEELVDKQRKEVLETFVKSLDYTKYNIEVLKDLNRVICDIQNLSVDTKEFVQRIDLIAEKTYTEVTNALREIRKE